MDYWKRKSEDLTKIAGSWWTFIFLNWASASLEFAAIAFADCLESHKAKDEVIKEKDAKIQSLRSDVETLTAKLASTEQLMFTVSNRMLSHVEGGRD